VLRRDHTRAALPAHLPHTRVLRQHVSRRPMLSVSMSARQHHTRESEKRRAATRSRASSPSRAPATHPRSPSARQQAARVLRQHVSSAYESQREVVLRRDHAQAALSYLRLIDFCIKAGALASGGRRGPSSPRRPASSSSLLLSSLELCDTRL